MPSAARTRLGRAAGFALVVALTAVAAHRLGHGATPSPLAIGATAPLLLTIGWYGVVRRPLVVAACAVAGQLASHVGYALAMPRAAGGLAGVLPTVLCGPHHETVPGVAVVRIVGAAGGTAGVAGMPGMDGGLGAGGWHAVPMLGAHLVGGAAALAAWRALELLVSWLASLLGRSPLGARAVVLPRRTPRPAAVPAPRRTPRDLLPATPRRGPPLLSCP